MLSLTHWGRVTHICIGKLVIIGADNGLSPGRRQAIIWTNAGLLSIGTLETNFSEIPIELQTFSFKKMHLKMSSGKWRPFCLGLNVLINLVWIWIHQFCCHDMKMISLLWGKSTSHWWFPSQRATNVKLWCFFVISLNRLLNK